VFTRSSSDLAGCPWLLPVLGDFIRKPFHELRIVDSACLEGLYAIEFARLGAEVVGIEGREQNLAKARFVKEVLSLDRLTLLQDDVRNLSLERHGSFDIVFCSGILYHLDVPDVFHFVQRIAEVCSSFLFLNTHISPAELGDNPAQLGQLDTFPFDGFEYTGRRYPEHDPGSNADQRMGKLWASLDNPSSVWFSIDSLRERLVRSRFHQVHHCLTYWNTTDRITLIATEALGSLDSTSRAGTGARCGRPSPTGASS
jgi:SAM-dependent methyltransferase